MRSAKRLTVVVKMGPCDVCRNAMSKKKYESSLRREFQKYYENVWSDLLSELPVLSLATLFKIAPFFIFFTEQPNDKTDGTLPSYFLISRRTHPPNYGSDIRVPQTLSSLNSLFSKGGH